MRINIKIPTFKFAREKGMPVTRMDIGYQGRCFHKKCARGGENPL